MAVSERHHAALLTARSDLEWLQMVCMHCDSYHLPCTAPFVTTVAHVRCWTCGEQAFSPEA